MTSVVVVSGSGRSGTSLTMQMLHACGLQVSDELIGASEANPRGAWEDRAIFAEESRLIELLGSRALPRQDYWRAEPLYGEVKSRLAQLLDERLSKTGSVWGFKDPQACLFLPLWQELSEAHSCDLRFVLCVRKADSVISSLVKTYEASIEHAQSMYFIRNVYAMADSPSNTFVLHYEDLLRRDINVLRELCCFCRLAVRCTDDELRTLMGKVCDAKLNRAGCSVGAPLAVPVRQLDQHLQFLRGTPADIDAVRQAGRALLAPLLHWDFVIEAARAALRDGKSKIADARERRVREVERVKEADAREIERLKQSNTRLRAEADRKVSVLRREIKRLENELSLARQIPPIKKQILPPSNKQLRQQLRAQMSAEVSKALGRPGRMLKLPGKLVRVYRKHRRAAQRARSAKRKR